ncbi:hypothetical protein LCGC14_2100950 [marine sediment metagenome]|uniref:Uncharacterized protein n=1 Tax=marine sediment metagenome TaxID=412755 RepID=A0A0F9H6G8_9ZZZZ
MSGLPDNWHEMTADERVVWILKSLSPELASEFDEMLREKHEDDPAIHTVYMCAICLRRRG